MRKKRRIREMPRLFVITSLLFVVNLVSSSHGDAGLPEELRRQLISLALGASATTTVVPLTVSAADRSVSAES